jgi:hypothetical protein
LSKKRSDCGAFFCDNTYAAILLSEYYYDKRYKMNDMGEAHLDPFPLGAKHCLYNPDMH